MTQDIIEKTAISCPVCNNKQTADIPPDDLQTEFDCPQCGAILHPLHDDCCVFCSYGDDPCPPLQKEKRDKYKKGLKTAMILSAITIGYNTVEGVVSTFFGATDETLALFGFGIDSFAEVLSGVGIAHMVWRMQQGKLSQRDQFEITALKITGVALYLLAAGLVIGALLAVINKAQPETTVAGIVIATLSVATMYFLYRKKMKVGMELNSAPIISDAQCTKTCFYLSFILLASSLTYHFWQISYVDALGSLGIAWYAWKEGKEAFEKAKSKGLTCNTECC